MKRFGIFALLVALGCFTIGCADTSSTSTTDTASPEVEMGTDTSDDSTADDGGTEAH